jgi:hypothetical protein
MAWSVCINEILTDDELRSILGRLGSDKDKEAFGLVCKKWLYLQSTERKKLAARAGPHMLRKMAARFSRVVELDLSQSVSRSFYPGVTDSDLRVIADGFRCLRVLYLQNCKGKLSLRFRGFFFFFFLFLLRKKRVCNLYGICNCAFVLDLQSWNGNFDGFWV